MSTFAHPLRHAIHKVIICGAISALGALPCFAVTSQWVAGTPELGYAAGDRSAALGVADPLDNPGAPEAHPVWVDTDGNTWMYQMPDNMWRYTPSTNIWTRMSNGGPSASLAYDKFTQATWTAPDGSLWLIDRLQYWRYDTQSNQWGQMGAFDALMTSGTMGVPSTVNSPGLREEPVTWTDANNDVYLFGGRYAVQSPTDPNSDRFGHDMWKYDTSDGTWVWLSGNFEYAGAPVDDIVYGMKGVFHPDNHPRGYRSIQSTWPSWVDASGNLWLYDDDELWQYDVSLNQWAWITGTPLFGGNPVYGTKGVHDPANSPGPKNGPIYWTDSDRNLWLYSTDLWKFDVSAKAWAWMGGSQGQRSQNTYVAPGIADPANWPASRGNGTSWTDPSGKLYMFGGYSFNDTWSYDPTISQWTYWKGANGRSAPEVLGTEDVPAPTNTPGSRKYTPSWTDKEGNFWMFSGDSYNLSQLWKFDSALQQWILADYYVSSPDFGELGVESSESHPGGRTSAATWVDNEGYAWLYGGYGLAADGTGYLSDLWRFNPVTENWAWMDGSKNRDMTSVTDSPDGGNSPGGRRFSSTWADAAGNLWLFGGYYSVRIPGYDNWFNPPFNITYFNDLWRLDLQTRHWHLVQPDTSVQQAPAYPGFANAHFGALGVYGQKGVPSAVNRPGSRVYTVTWTDHLGNFWMFGGEGYGADGSVGRPNALNDLWKFSPYTGMWTWVNGSNQIAQTDAFIATRDQFDPVNQPGGRIGATGWAVGNQLLLHGGRPGTSPVYQNMQGLINALWTYDIPTNTWAWTSSQQPPMNFGSYGTKGVASENNFPGMRADAMAWKDNNNQLWLYGGQGYAQWGTGLLDDVWKINSLPAAAEEWLLYE